MSIPSFTLNNGVEIPAVGFGVFQTPPDETIAAIDALDTGVRGGPEPEAITRDAYGIEIPEA
jgi:diketogulonate reductase-like aldo/keto reductase